MPVLTRTGYVVAIGGTAGAKKVIVAFPPTMRLARFTTPLALSGIAATDQVTCVFDTTTGNLTSMVKV